MGLCVSRWLVGEETFAIACYYYWCPHLLLAKENGKNVVKASFLMARGENLLVEACPEHSRDEFIDRYNFAISKAAEIVGMSEWITNEVKNYPTTLNVCDLYKLSEAFQDFILTYDMLNEVPLYKRISSLIFFDSWELIKHYKILLKKERA